jgi:hypothetical protein
MKVDLLALTPAERLLWEFGITEPQHIDLDGIAVAHSAKVVYRPLSGCEARLVGDHERAIITINNRDVTSGRQRFSLAHELGHWLKDRHLRLVTCVKDDMSPSTMEARNIESAANDFASQLVLPNFLAIPSLAGKAHTLDTASKLAQTFRASVTAAAIRMTKLSRGPVALVCHRQGGLSWFLKSIQLPHDVRIVRQLHQDTEAFAMAFGAGGNVNCAKVEPANRWLTMPDCWRREVVVQSMKLPSNRVLTMLELKPELQRRK